MSRSRRSSARLALASIAFFASGHPAAAQEQNTVRAETDYAAELPYIPPKSPAESLAAFRIHPGFRIELAAAEPMLASPVALDFDEDGRAYVAEFTEFNQKDSKYAHGRGRVRLLEDTDDDGAFDRSTVFLDDLDATTAVCCYGGGVFVGAIPSILYAKDTDGDGKADIRRVVFTGFGRDAGGEALFNSFRWRFDNRIHLSTSNSGGEVRHAALEDERPVSVRGQGLLFDPRTEEFAVTSGGGQHGMSLDDWGRKFVCTSHDPVFLVMYDGRYLARNPYLDGPAAAVRIAGGGYDTKVFKISPNEPWRIVRTRLRTTGVEEPHPTEGDQPSGYFSAASGVTIFRGDAWPPDFHGNVFVGEVANNLIYRARLVPDGVGLRALRADAGVEFLASADMWFRPVQMANGPDGALYVIDMYRQVIEAAEFMPPYIAKHLDIGAGFDRGRIYRIVPEAFRRPKVLRLGKLAAADLVPLLDHPNGWHRDTASRLLYERQDPSAVAPLRKLAAEAGTPLGRMHSLYALDGLKALDPDTVLGGLRDPDPRVREHAVRLAEPFESAPGVRARLEALIDDPELRVRYQVAFSLGAVSGEMPTRALARLARRDGADRWFRLAILSSSSGRAGELFRLLVEDAEFRILPHARTFLTAMADLIGRANRAEEIEALLRGLDFLTDDERSLGRDLLQALIARLPSAGRERFFRLDGARALLDDLLGRADETARDVERPAADRVEAIRMLGLAPLAAHEGLFRELLESRQPLPVQAAAVETLAGFDEPRVPALLLEVWPGFSPRLRATAVEAFFSRPAWIPAFLDAVEEDRVKAIDVDPARIQSLLAHADSRVRSRTALLFDAAKLERREDVVAAYRESLRLGGDRARGKAAFEKQCSACHQLEGIGAQIGADLKAIRDQSAEAILLHILDPNREIKPQFQSYLLETDDRTFITGLITEETANSITIRRADGSTETVLRVHIRELQGTGLSFMPEGLEKQIGVASMADLLAYLKSVQ